MTTKSSDRWSAFVREKTSSPYSNTIIRWNRSSSTSDSAYSYTFLRSVVCLSVVCLSHSCPLLKPFDGFRNHLADKLI